MAKQRSSRIKLVPKAAPYTNLTQVALLLTKDQIAGLNQLERETTKQRQSLKGKDIQIGGAIIAKDQRITKNAFIRALIDILLERSTHLNLAAVINESDLRRRIQKALSIK